MIFCVIVATLIVLALANSPPVKISLKTSWNAAPFELEFIECASSLNKAYLLPLLDAINDLKDTPTPEEKYKNFLKTSPLSEAPDSTRSLLDMYLASRMKAPTVEAYYQYYLNHILPRFEDKQFDASCENWVEYSGNQFCSFSALETALKASQTSTPTILPFDHIIQPKVVSKITHETSSSDIPVVILYSDLKSSGFHAFHKDLKQLSESQELAYIIRWKPSEHEEKLPLFVGGYGVELALKSTEYKVVDDQKVAADDTTSDAPKDIQGTVFGQDFDNLKTLGYDQDTVDRFKDHFLKHLDVESRVRSLKSWELNDLSFKTASFVMDSDIPLSALRIVSQDFPRHAGFLSKYTENANVTRAITTNQRSALLETDGLDFFINGLGLPADKVDIYSLFSALKIEALASQDLQSFGLSYLEAQEVLIKSIPSKAKSQAADHEAYDLREEWEKPGKKKAEGVISSVFWWNDVEKDSRYSKWSRSLYGLLQHGGGGIPAVRKNLYNVIFMVDLQSPIGLQAIAFGLDLIKNNLPIRFGLLPLFNSENGVSVSEMIARCLYFLQQEYGKKAGAEFLGSMLEPFKTSKDSVKNEATVQKAFESVLKSAKAEASRKGTFVTVAKTKGTFEDVDLYISAVEAKLDRAGFKPHSGAISDGSMFINGLYFELDGMFQQQLSGVIKYFVGTLQRMVYSNQLAETSNVQDILLKEFNAKARRNPYISTSDKSPLKMVRLTGDGGLGLSDLKKISYFEASADTKQLTFWYYGDFSSENFQKSVASVLKHMQNTPTSFGKKSRVHFVNTGKDNVAEDVFVKELLNEFEQSDELELFGQKITVGKLSKKLVTSSFEPLLRYSKPLVHQLVVNGRRIGPFPELFVLSEFDLDVIYESETKKVSPISESLIQFEKELTSDVTMLTVATIYHAAVSHVSKTNLFEIGTQAEGLTRYSWFKKPSESKGLINIGDPEKSLVHIAVVLDPLSNNAQKLSAILESFSVVHNFFHIQIFLNPVKIASSELPLKRFYRFAYKSVPQFDKSGLKAPILQFNDIPTEPLLTMGVDVPQAWVVMPVSAAYDLDNIKLKEVEAKGINAVVELKYILVEGHAREEKTYAPPRGLQFVLGIPKSPGLYDTIVMANLGYFQLKANPGVLQMKVRDGRSTEFYDLTRVEDRSVELVAKNGKIDVILNGFEGTTLFTMVTKKPEKENEELLDETSEGPGILSSLFGWNTKKEEPHAEINIFSVASGHLYERFLRIMILSVMKTTKHTVKFWFIENFLSPQFKDFIPHMAKTIGFKYELVTYKWPKWLRNQSEKQRTIWGYKILFLDVLFPLDLDKVIFVDADQIVRTDFKELIDMDLQGAPYGYTPFCNSRKETEGFRFWNGGYWKEHLRGKPYHIRQIAAGDRLRQQYQMLSADPNSLANLDQDLPNDMQHQVPIFSLPQSWLWCETWCDDESLTRAKTIDMCNNPLTKEPKLDRAQRLLPEWRVFDEEQRQLYDAWKSTKTQQKQPQKQHDEL